MYDEVAAWWPLLSAPADYADEAAEYTRILEAHSERQVDEVLELGSGGGNNASHMKPRWSMTLVDRAPRMLEISRALNPECVHVEGDMRTVRLGHEFDAVFVHDAVSYLTTESELREAFRTAWEHLRVGGVALFVPDHVRETYRPSTGRGGHDADGRAMRYLSWTFDPDPNDTTYSVAFAYLFRDAGTVRCVDDLHTMGLFPRATWLGLLEQQGFEARHALLEVAGPRECFLGIKPNS